ncbi:protein disulfide-isomerase precursor [Mortierella sp. GBA35]|nr:protein disulfide-isomerase precursor [Mortierella sp. GBA35]
MGVASLVVFIVAAWIAIAQVVAASNVLPLTNKTFRPTIRGERVIMVAFIAPWCKHCQELAPQYELAATRLKDSGVVLAKVDCTIEAGLCAAQDIDSYPTLKVYRGDRDSEYEGAVKADAIVSYLKV